MKAAAKRRAAEAAATALLQVVWDPDAPAVTDPLEALMELGGKLKHATDVLGARISSGDLDEHTRMAWQHVLREQRQLLTSMQAMGIEERRVRLAEAAGQQLAGVIRAILERMLALVVEAIADGAAGDALRFAWDSAAMQVVPEELRRLSPGGEGVRGEVE